MIDGVSVTPLKQIVDERGKILHFLRSDDPEFSAFGEVYFSQVYPGVVKGWHIHKEMELNYVCPVGKIKMVLYDARDGSPTKGEVMELYLGPENYVRVKVPPMVWNGFKGVDTGPSLVANCASHPHRKDEIERLDPADSSIPYDWSLKHG